MQQRRRPGHHSLRTAMEGLTTGDEALVRQLIVSDDIDGVLAELERDHLKHVAHAIHELSAFDAVPRYIPDEAPRALLRTEQRVDRRAVIAGGDLPHRRSHDRYVDHSNRSCSSGSRTACKRQPTGGVGGRIGTTVQPAPASPERRAARNGGSAAPGKVGFSWSASRQSPYAKPFEASARYARAHSNVVEQPAASKSVARLLSPALQSPERGGTGPAAGAAPKRYDVLSDFSVSVDGRSLSGARGGGRLPNGAATPRTDGNNTNDDDGEGRGWRGTPLSSDGHSPSSQEVTEPPPPPGPPRRPTFAAAREDHRGGPSSEPFDSGSDPYNEYVVPTHITPFYDVSLSTPGVDVSEASMDDSTSDWDVPQTPRRRTMSSAAPLDATDLRRPQRHHVGSTGRASGCRPASPSESQPAPWSPSHSSLHLSRQLQLMRNYRALAALCKPQPKAEAGRSRVRGGASVHPRPAAPGPSPREAPLQRHSHRDPNHVDRVADSRARRRDARGDFAPRQWPSPRQQPHHSGVATSSGDEEDEYYSGSGCTGRDGDELVYGDAYSDEYSDEEDELDEFIDDVDERNFSGSGRYERHAGAPAAAWGRSPRARVGSAGRSGGWSRIEASPPAPSKRWDRRSAATQRPPSAQRPLSHHSRRHHRSGSERSDRRPPPHRTRTPPQRRSPRRRRHRSPSYSTSGSDADRQTATTEEASVVDDASSYVERRTGRSRGGQRSSSSRSSGSNDKESARPKELQSMPQRLPPRIIERSQHRRTRAAPPRPESAAHRSQESPSPASVSNEGRFVTRQSPVADGQDLGLRSSTLEALMDGPSTSTSRAETAASPNSGLADGTDLRSLHPNTSLQRSSTLLSAAEADNVAPAAGAGALLRRPTGSTPLESPLNDSVERGGALVQHSSHSVSESTPMLPRSRSYDVPPPPEQQRSQPSSSKSASEAVGEYRNLSVANSPSPIRDRGSDNRAAKPSRPAASTVHTSQPTPKAPSSRRDSGTATHRTEHSSGDGGHGTATHTEAPGTPAGRRATKRPSGKRSPQKPKNASGARTSRQRAAHHQPTEPPSTSTSKSRPAGNRKAGKRSQGSPATRSRGTTTPHGHASPVQSLRPAPSGPSKPWGDAQAWSEDSYTYSYSYSYSYSSDSLSGGDESPLSLGGSRSRSQRHPPSRSASPVGRAAVVPASGRETPGLRPHGVLRRRAPPSGPPPPLSAPKLLAKGQPPLPRSKPLPVPNRRGSGASMPVGQSPVPQRGGASSMSISSSHMQLWQPVSLQQQQQQSLMRRWSASGAPANVNGSGARRTPQAGPAAPAWPAASARAATLHSEGQPIASAQQLQPTPMRVAPYTKQLFQQPRGSRQLSSNIFAPPSDTPSVGNRDALLLGTSVGSIRGGGQQLSVHSPSSLLPSVEKYSAQLPILLDVSDAGITQRRPSLPKKDVVQRRSDGRDDVDVIQRSIPDFPRAPEETPASIASGSARVDGKELQPLLWRSSGSARVPGRSNRIPSSPPRTPVRSSPGELVSTARSLRRAPERPPQKVSSAPPPPPPAPPRRRRGAPTTAKVSRKQSTTEAARTPLSTAKPHRTRSSTSSGGDAPVDSARFAVEPPRSPATSHQQSGSERFTNLDEHVDDGRAEVIRPLRFGLAPSPTSNPSPRFEQPPAPSSRRPSSFAERSTPSRVAAEAAPRIIQVVSAPPIPPRPPKPETGAVLQQQFHVSVT